MLLEFPFRFLGGTSSTFLGPTSQDGLGGMILFHLRDMLSLGKQKFLESPNKDNERTRPPRNFPD